MIIDGDWGVDELQLASVLIAAPEKVNILGATCVFGNTSLENVAKNTGRILSWLGRPDIAYYPGAEKPLLSELPPGDGAHGDDGIGGVVLPDAKRSPDEINAVDFILESLRIHDPNTVIITATGPLTNIAMAIQQDPETMKRVKEIVVMGGCTEVMPANDIFYRQGNITPYAEFNWFMDPDAAQVVMKSKLPIRLFPMNCTHQLTLTQQREKQIETTFSPDVAGKLIGMMAAPRELDMAKFGISPVMHDVNTALAILYPDAYKYNVGNVQVALDGANRGQSSFTSNHEAPIKVANRILTPQQLFDVVLGSLKTALLGDPNPSPTISVPNPT